MHLPFGVGTVAVASSVLAALVAALMIHTARGPVRVRAAGGQAADGRGSGGSELDAARLLMLPSLARADRLLIMGSVLASVNAVGGILLARMMRVDWSRSASTLTPRGLIVTAVLVAGGMVSTSLLLVGLTRLPGVAGSAHVLIRHLLDALVIGAAICFLGWILIADPTRILGSATPNKVCQVMLGGSSFASVAVGMAIIVTTRTRRRRLPIARVAFAVALVSVAGMALASGVRCGWAPVVVTGEIALPIGLILLAWAVRSHHRAPLPEPSNDFDPDLDPVDVRSSTAFAFLPVGVISVAAIYHMFRGGQIEAFGLGAGIVEGVALVIRKHLALLDVRRYADRLSEREEHFRVLAHTDPLTGLPNRRGLLNTLYEDARGGPPCVLLGLDLDGFKNINDMRGHDVGDAVLIEVGQRLRANLRPGDMAARLGGDEFAVLMWARPTEAQPIAERLLAVLSRPYEQPTGHVFLSASIGLAGCATADDVPSLLRNADLALRYAKQRGKSRVEQYDVVYERRLIRRTTLEHELRGVIDRDELHLAYQPVVSLPSMRPAGAEALLRWHHPELGPVPPDEFIPVAEESGMIAKLGTWVLHQACHQLSLWLAAGHDVWVSVNVSPYELHAPEYVTQVAEVLRAHRVPPQRLVLEVTEHAVATDLDELVRRLGALRATGVRVALDDFGAGYSSLGQLRNLPVDILKIDHSLVAELDPSRGRSAAPLVDVVTQLGHRLGLEVIAEGITRQEQRGMVVDAGCRFGQGILFGRAVPAEHLEAQLAAAAPHPAVQHVRSVDSAHEMRQA